MSIDLRIGDIIGEIFIALIIFIISSMIHELSHWMMCKALKCRVIGLKVFFLCYNGKKWCFRTGGKNYCAFITADRNKMKKIVMAGPLAEFIVAAFFLLIGVLVNVRYSGGLIGGSGLILFSVIYNLLPITNGDGKILFMKGNE